MTRPEISSETDTETFLRPNDLRPIPRLFFETKSFSRPLPRLVFRPNIFETNIETFS